MHCLITGGTSGIGSATVRALVRLGGDVIFTGRSRERGQQIEKRLRQVYPDRSIQFHPLELSSMAQIHRFAEEILERNERIDCLINNAGARFDHFQKSLDGIEMTFAVNHLAHFLLTIRLLPALMRAEHGQVLTISSSASGSAKVMQNQWIEKEEDYDRKQAYAKSKLANLLFGIELANRLRDTNATSNVIDPGVVATRFASNNGSFAWARHVLSHWLRRELTSVVSEGSSIAEVATRGNLRSVSGKLLRRGEVVDSRDCAGEQPKLARSLWELSVELSGVNFGSHPVTSSAGTGVL